MKANAFIKVCHVGFTLIEMLVVIAIIGILAGVMIGSFSGGTENARAARCLSNMRNLAAACQSYAVSTLHYPCAGSIEKMSVSSKRSSRSGRQTKSVYEEVKGWISWNSRGAYRSKPSSSVASASWNLSTYEMDEDSRTYALTNGAIWMCVSANRDVFRCPTHVIKKKNLNPNWSYVMNAYFEWTPRPGTDVATSEFAGVRYGNLDRADRRLLFAEIPFMDVVVQSQEQTAAGEPCDCVLQYKGADGTSSAETIGFNHSAGKRHYCAHVVFADGHTEKLMMKKNSLLSQGEIQDLTTWLCEGRDVSYDGSKYEKMTN